MIRCYDCGCELTAGEAVRRDVVVSRGGGYGHDARGPVYLGTSQTARVDLCPGCDDWRARREAAVPRLLLRAVRTIAVVVGVLALALCLTAGVALVIASRLRTH